MEFRFLISMVIKKNEVQGFIQNVHSCIIKELHVCCFAPVSNSCPQIDWPNSYISSYATERRGGLVTTSLYVGGPKFTWMFVVYIRKYDRTVWCGWMIVNSKGCTLKVRVLSTYLYGESDKNTRNLNHIVRWPGRHSKRAHPSYKPEELMHGPPSAGLRLKCCPIERLSWLRFCDKFLRPVPGRYLRSGHSRIIPDLVHRIRTIPVV